MKSEPATARILDAATRLFAERGFDGASTRLIAEAAGLNIATVNYHVGGKRDLYFAVMTGAAEAERAALEAALDSCAEPGRLTGPADVHLVVDRYLDFCVARPEIPALWMHRWLSDADDVAVFEAAHVNPLVSRLIELTRPVAAPGADVEYALWSVIWTVHGFARGGVPDASGRRRRTDDPEALQRFRAALHRLVSGLLALEHTP
ncbi:helix-turn-helix domain-containing protein [Actinocorallia sp. A-T 12471]|uniref:TetR/AcrR family transcriptional regulator n=1 Tax=Actinocorallia sp. A-T 12471 TaxID=3089813 RepID=UPI0029D3F319|nr:helix-turn-helix domain-containing protein [Actinocorallia sp. A-T 12471]MDX6741275.1 helix-turn-helix domain-containing protein [Actinocorallia sp. A-T 12471]